MRPATIRVPEYVRQVEIRRTEYGIPHIRAENLGAMGFGLGYTQMEDYGIEVVNRLIAGRGESARNLGREALESDFAARERHARAVDVYHTLSQDVRDIMQGFAAAGNYYIGLNRGEFPDWVAADFTGHDIAARDVGTWSRGAARRFLERVTSTSTRGIDDEVDPEDGSNAWAFGPSRTTSGNAILMRNPHLSWTAGYYEGHVTVPGVMNFYGDFRIGGPFGIVCGFNEYLGWATTNNYPTLDQVYELDADPEHPGGYLFDGGRVPVSRKTYTVEYADGETLNRETRDNWRTPLGPVIRRTDEKIYILRSTTDGEYRRPEQVLRMMRAKSLAEWQAAVKMRTLPSSNLTYADRAGNIYYVWNTALPLLPHPLARDSAVHVTRTSEIWTELVPFEALPQLLNPTGGYVQNANDPPFYTNLNEILNPTAFPRNMPPLRLRLRSQHSLQLVHTDSVLGLEDVTRLKHSMRMPIADRLKDDLVAAVRESRTDAELLKVSDLLEQWDNTAAADSRGSVLFKMWMRRYSSLTDSTTRFREQWSPDAPVETPRGLGDTEAALEAFDWAVEEAVGQWGSWDVAWGDVHRVRMGEVDVPVGGCDSGFGCFRTLSFSPDEDGRLVANRGDGWVFAVEFGATPRAYSVLAYGQSIREDSPHFSDQAAMFAENRMKRVAFTEAEIRENLIRSYRPGRERGNR
jgi:acyl-homoserine-lactone acylase